MRTQAYIYSSGRRQLFGGDENGGTELDEVVKQGENGQCLVTLGHPVDCHHAAQEIAASREEKLAYEVVRHALRSSDDRRRRDCL